MTLDRLPAVLKAMAGLVQQDVLVGVPASSVDRREPGQMNNATLAYIHDTGAPAANIPARPFMGPGIRAEQDEITDRLKKAAGAALDGNQARVQQQLTGAGVAGQSGVRGAINDGVPPPLATSTLKARLRQTQRGREGVRQELANRAAGEAPSTDLAKPLVNTGQMRNAITYVVRSK